jgi:hypothetical protein
MHVNWAPILDKDMRKIKISALDRFLSKIKINKKTKCWEIEPFLNKRYTEINIDNRIKQCRGVSKINEAIRLKIFKDFKDGNKRSVISRKYNVSWTTINRVLIHGNQIS